MKNLNSSGFSMIEVLLATVLIGVALGFSMDAAKLISWSKVNSSRQELASRVAVTQMEELISTYSSDLRLQNGTHSQIFDRSGVITTDPSPMFTANWTITRDRPITKILQIDLRVSWNDGSASRGVQLMSFRKY